jgi:DNA polymerase III sliding clamp (beta) subunit (PCNA family)
MTSSTQTTASNQTSNSQTAILQRILVPAAALRAALDIAVTEKKTTIPVLTHVQLEPSPAGLRVLSTDLDLWAITEVEAALETDQPILLPHQTVLMLLKGETGLVTLSLVETTETYTELERGQYVDDKYVPGPEIEKQRVTTTLSMQVGPEEGGGGCLYDLPIVKPDSFPQHPEIPEPTFAVSGTTLKEMLARIRFAISHEESRYTLNGALLRVANSELSLVGTDGNRLALARHEIAAPDCQTLIPTCALAWLAKSVGKQPVAIAFTQDSAFWEVPELRTTLINRKLAGQFPNFEAVMPRRDALHTVALFPAADELAKSLAKVARMADERSGAVTWRVNGSCILSAQSTETGKATAKVPASITHDTKTTSPQSDSQTAPEIVTGLSSEYVLDFLKTAGKNPVTLRMKDAQNAILFETEAIPGYSYVLMPMRI